MELETAVKIDGVDYTVKAITEWAIFLGEAEPKIRLYVIGVYHSGGSRVTRDLTYTEVKEIQKALLKEYRERQK